MYGVSHPGKLSFVLPAGIDALSGEPIDNLPHGMRHRRPSSLVH
jgi:hypothetical protein